MEKLRNDIETHPPAAFMFLSCWLVSTVIAITVFPDSPVSLSSYWPRRCGAANQWIHVQSSSDLKNWEDIWSGWMGAAGVKQVADKDMSPKAMFYRAVLA